MNGIPVRIRREGESETVYLSCARVGPLGETLRDLKRAARALWLKQAELEQAIGLTLAEASRLKDETTPMAQVEALAAKQRVLLRDAVAVKDERLEACQKLWLAALRPNHGPDAEEIVNSLTDNQVLAAPVILEKGETPDDFFPSREAPTSASATAPGSGSSRESCSSTDSDKATLKAAG